VTLWNLLTKAKTRYFLITLRNFFCDSLLILNYSTYKLTKLSKLNKIMAAILCIYKIEHRMQICLRNPIIACSTDHVGNIPLRELNLILKNRATFEKSLYYPRSMCSSRPTQRYHFQADLNWCDSTFKCLTKGKLTINKFLIW
jgi:hypothetical protein